MGKVRVCVGRGGALAKEVVVARCVYGGKQHLEEDLCAFKGCHSSLCHCPGQASCQQLPEEAGRALQTGLEADTAAAGMRRRRAAWVVSGAASHDDKAGLKAS